MAMSKSSRYASTSLLHEKVSYLPLMPLQSSGTDILLEDWHASAVRCHTLPGAPADYILAQPFMERGDRAFHECG